MFPSPEGSGNINRPLPKIFEYAELQAARTNERSPFLDLKEADPNVQLLTYQKRQNSCVGTLRFEGREVFFKQRPTALLAVEARALEVVNKLGFVSPTLFNLFWGTSEALMLQEYIPDLTSRQLTSLLEGKDPRDSQRLDDWFGRLYESSRRHLCVAAERTANDRFFTDRAAPGGRIATLYREHEFNLAGTRQTFSALLEARFVVDGVTYRETFGELFEKTKAVLSSKTQRPLWLSHGDIVETNIYRTSDPSAPFGMIDLEVTGMNWALGDVVIPLIAMAYMFDYTLPRYQPLYEHSHEWKEKPACNVDVSNGVVRFDEVAGFDSSVSRAQACQQYLTQVAYPLIKDIESLCPVLDFTIDEQLRAIFFMRLIGAHDISRWNPNDQARAFALMVKLCATPLRKDVETPLKIFEAML